MEFELNREEKMIQKAIRDFVTKELKYEVVRELDEKGSFPDKLMNSLAELGFLGLTIPEVYGGEGLNPVGACIVTEELSRRYPALGACYANTLFCAGPVITTLGTEEQKSRLLPAISSGELRVALALDQERLPGEGTRAEENGQFFLISGEEPMVALGDVADQFLVLAQTEGRDSMGIFCVDANARGVTREKVEALGCRGENLVNLLLNQVRVEGDALLGGTLLQGMETKQMEALKDFQLLGIAAQAVGMAQGAFDLSLDHAKNRVQFDQIIGRFTAIQEKFTDLLCQIVGAKFLVYNAALAASAGKKVTREVAIAKITASRTAVQASMDGLQIFGGYGYSMEYDIQRYVRDAAGTLSAGASNDNLGRKIAKSIGL